MPEGSVSICISIKLEKLSMLSWIVATSTSTLMRLPDSLLTARMKSYETAFGMQAEIPEVFDFLPISSLF